MLQQFENEIFIQENFSDVELGDARLVSRLQEIGNKMANNPKASIPTQMENWNDTKACYDFFRNPKVTHKRIQLSHRKRVKQLAIDASNNGETVLYIHDLSELDYSTHKATEGLGQIGNQYGRGIQMHSCLAVVAGNNPEILGLAHQVVWERQEKENRGKPKIGEQFRGKKESIVWSQVLRALGRPPIGCRWVSVSDRGSDCDEFFFEAMRLKWDVLIRACHDRCIVVNNNECKLKEFVTSMKPQGQHVILIRKKGETVEREIVLNVAWEADVILSPSVEKNKEIPVSVIRCWNEEEGIEWILYSSIRVNSFDEAIEKITWYAGRWIIEEYHKCIKTGCKIESRQLEKSKALEALVGLLGIIAILMLKMRNLARESGDELVKEHIPETALKIVCTRFKLNSQDLTIYGFWRAVARMGGFLNRKSDGEPGWQTLWQGWLRLLDMMAGVDAILNAS